MAAHSVGPGTYSKTPKDFKQVFELFDLVRHISQAAGLREPPAVSNFQERLKVSASIGYRSTDFSGPTVMRGVNSPLFTEGALIRDPRAVPNLCKADSGLSAMFGILAAISSHLVARCKILSYTCSCPTALRL